MTNCEVAEAGWTIEFKSYNAGSGGDGENFFLWIGKQGKN